MGSARKQGGTKHLRFVKQPLDGGKKLHKYTVINNQYFERIGIIHWRGGWRQYVFQADSGVDMSRVNVNEFD